LLPREEMVEERSSVGAYRVEATGGPVFLRFVEGEPRGLQVADAMAADRWIPASTTKMPATHYTDLDRALAVGGIEWRPAGWHAWVPWNLTRAAWPTDHVLFVYGARIVWQDGAVWATGPGERTDVVRDPATGSRFESQARHVAVLQLSESTVNVGTPAAWSAIAKRAIAHVEGEIVWTGATSQLMAGSNPVPPDDDILHVKGTVNVGARLDEESHVWQVDGDAQFVGVNGVPVVGALVQGVGVAAGAIALVAAVLFAAGRDLITFVVGRSTPRLVKARPLGNGTRRGIMREIHRTQAITAPQLALRLDKSPATIRYHLRILESFDFLDCSGRDGARRDRIYFLNSGSFGAPSDYAPGSRGRRAVVAIASHPARRALFEAVARQPGATYAALEALIAKADGTAPSRSTASDHLRFLVDAGAINEERQGRWKTYWPRIQMTQLRMTQYEQYLRHERLQGLFSRLAAGDMRSEDAIVLVCQEMGAVANPRRARERIQRAVESGLLEVNQQTREIGVPDYLRPLARRFGGNNG
jgi:DNA-binding transcriptional ArsR family regulator